MFVFCPEEICIVTLNLTTSVYSNLAPYVEVISNSDDITLAQGNRNWDEPELIRVKGDNVAREDMGRMIDPYLFPDKDITVRWWCFYKQNGVSMSYSSDLSNWTYFGRAKCGENVCVLVDKDEYVLFHSPRNGIGVMRSKDLKNWQHEKDVITLGQGDWPWAENRITAGVVVDLRNARPPP